MSQPKSLHNLYNCISDWITLHIYLLATRPIESKPIRTNLIIVTTLNGGLILVRIRNLFFLFLLNLKIFLLLCRNLRTKTYEVLQFLTFQKILYTLNYCHPQK